MKQSLINIAYLAPRIIRAATTKNKSKTPYYVFRTRFGVCCRFFKKVQLKNMFFKLLEVFKGIKNTGSLSDPWFDYKHYEWMCECTKTNTLFSVSIEEMVKGLQAALDAKARSHVQVYVNTKLVIRNGLRYLGVVIRPESDDYCEYLEGLLNRASAITVQTSKGSDVEVFGTILESKLQEITKFVEVKEINNG